LKTNRFRFFFIFSCFACSQNKKELPFSNYTNIFNQDGEVIFQMELSDPRGDTATYQFTCNQFFESSPFIDLNYDKWGLFPSGELEILDEKIFIRPEDPNRLVCFGSLDQRRFMLADFRRRHKGFLEPKGGEIYWLEMKDIFTIGSNDYYYYQRNDCRGGTLGYIISPQRGIIGFHYSAGRKVDGDPQYYFGDPFFLNKIKSHLKGEYIITNDRIVKIRDSEQC
jgi:hypothetical protein